MLDNGLVGSLPEEAGAQRAAEILAPIARAAAERGCKLGLYNHGGWFGEPDHQIQIIETLRDRGVENVGMVYNFHHGHEHVKDFADRARRMAPYLLTVNVNGMRIDGPKILSFGHGIEEAKMIDALLDAGYAGPIGILGHREDRDAEECLQESLQGLEQLTASETGETN
jgi:sugar phosphate isomerase/epimerase